MSENTGTPVAPRKKYLKILFIFLSLFILMVVYGAGSIVFPLSIFGIFQNKNCDTVLTLHKVYTALYPAFMEDKSLLDQVRECEAYVSAASSEKNGSWRAAYDGYRAYRKTYPNGLYAGEAHEHSGIVLANLVKEQVEQKAYEEAAKNLNLIVSNYSDTSVSEQSGELASTVYTSWGADLREASDFEGSEKVLIDYKSWCQKHRKSDLLAAAHELVQTYLAWSQDLQSQYQYQDALAKLDQAAAVADPESAVQVKASQSEVYVAWGNDLLGQKDFQAAIEKFQQAASSAEVSKNGDARDALANGYIQWASSLGSTEDFSGAVDQLKLAKAAAVSDTAIKSVDTALQDIYLAFSKSSGQQARRAMKEALRTVCEKHGVPDLPIFGLNKDSIRFGMYGKEVDDQLPSELVAQTPGEMHYIACITPDQKVIQSRDHKNIVLKVRGGYYYTLSKQYRAQIIWNVSLLQVDTGKSVGEQTFTGGQPPEFSDAGGNYFYGPTPMDEFTEWLKSFMK